MLSFETAKNPADTKDRAEKGALQLDLSDTLTHTQTHTQTRTHALMHE